MGGDDMTKAPWVESAYRTRDFNTRAAALVGPKPRRREKVVVVVEE